MHCIVSLKLIEKINIQEKGEFLLGGIAADASENKEGSHFFGGDHEDYTRRIAFEKFYDQYKHHEHQSYIQGYYAHLIADHIWLTGFFAPWLKNRIKNDPSIQEKYHNDFSLLNSKLANEYNITASCLHNLGDVDIPDLQEVCATDVKKLFTILESDLQSSAAGSLQVFTLDQIIGYIETSIQVSRQKISQHWHI